MDTQKLTNICQAVTHGNPRQVINLENQKKGTIISCNSGELTVMVEGKQEIWSYDACEAVNDE